MRRSFQTAMITAVIAFAPSMACHGAQAGEVWYEFWEPYLQRNEGVTRGSGNAKDVNAVTHMVDPWPRYVGNRHIPANGERMAGAVERYRRGRLQFAPPPISPIYTTNAITTAGTGAAGLGGIGAGGTDGAPVAVTATATGR